MFNLNKLSKFNVFNNDIIEIYCVNDDIKDVIEKPRPAIKTLPKWFKDLPSLVSDVDGDDRVDAFGLKHKTAKACPPLLDAFSLGITIPFPTDLHVKSNHNCGDVTVIEPFKNIFALLESHSDVQIGGSYDKVFGKNNRGGKILKFLNPWIIKTSPGWSCLFIHPINHFDLPFTCIGGVVETDKYFAPVNFPAIWTLPNANYHINAGDPLITVIPFKRVNLKQVKPKKLTPKLEKKFRNTQMTVQAVRSSHYKKMREKNNE